MLTYTHILTHAFLDELKNALYEAGEIMLSADRTSGEVAGVSEKGNPAEHVNFVTLYDKKVQAFLIERLGASLPEARFLAEEEGASSTDPSEGLCFVIDPIDGTANFIRDYGCSAISVALLAEGEPVLGAVYQPYADELFLAVKGQGTVCYADHVDVGHPVHVSTRPFNEAIAVLGTAPYYKDELGGLTVRLFEAFLYQAADVRRSGSAAYDFCNLAAGRTDIFAEARLSPWDYAAGALIVTEAGGIITQLNGTPLRFDAPCSVLAAGKDCYGDAVTVLNG